MPGEHLTAPAGLCHGSTGAFAAWDEPDDEGDANQEPCNPTVHVASGGTSTRRFDIVKWARIHARPEVRWAPIRP